VREPCIVGVEDAFFQIVRRELEDLGVKVTQYMGLLVAEGVHPTSTYLSAHVDRHGLLCTGPNEFQYAAFIAGNRGELNGDSVSEQLMDMIAGRFQGARVQAHTARSGTYLGQGVIMGAAICPRRRNLFFNVEGLEFLPIGTPVSFIDRLIVNRDTISAQLDNVVTVAMSIELFRRGFQGTAFFTAGEEAGRSWRYLAEWFQRKNVQTERLLVLDTSPFPDATELANQDVVLRRRDANAQFSQPLTEQLGEKCERLNIRYRFKDEYITDLNQRREKPLSLGRTELGRLIEAVPEFATGTTLQLPTMGYHTQMETANISAVEKMLLLLDAFLNETPRKK
jgi:putative aminopeptidase FrvX